MAPVQLPQGGGGHRHLLPGRGQVGGGRGSGRGDRVVYRYQGQIASENITLNTVSRWLVLIVWVCLID